MSEENVSDVALLDIWSVTAPNPTIVLYESDL
jgi:hypothetical protein